MFGVIRQQMHQYSLKHQSEECRARRMMTRGALNAGRPSPASHGMDRKGNGSARCHANKFGRHAPTDCARTEADNKGAMRLLQKASQRRIPGLNLGSE